MHWFVLTPFTFDRIRFTHLQRYLLILFLLFPFLKVDAQSIKGTVVDGETGLPLSAVTVLISETQKVAFTDANGYFIIDANTGDRVAFSLPGYRPEYRKKPFTVDGVATMRVELFKLSYELDEFVFRPKYTPYQLDSINRRETYSRVLARHKSSIASPLSWTAEKFSKRAKRIFKFQKMYNGMEEQKFIDTRYTPAIVAQMTGLQGDTLAHFMNANPLPSDFARAATDLELKMWIRENYKAWMKNPVIPFTSSHDSISTSIK